MIFNITILAILWVVNKLKCFYPSQTFADFQTLGEEYAGIIQVDFKKQNLPSKLSRLVSVFLHSFGIIVTSNIFKKLEKKISEKKFDDIDTKRTILKIVSLVRKTFVFVEKLNLSVFYLGGAFYLLSKRVAGIEYAMLRQSSIDLANVENFGQTFKVLGYLTLINLLGSTAIVLMQDYFNKIKSFSSNSDETSSISRHVPSGQV